jgi:Tfp pilus assembly protein PilO
MKLTPTIFLILSLAIFFVFISPEQGNIEVLEAEKQSLAADNQKAAEYQAKKTELIEQFRDNVSDDQEARLKQFLPDSVDNVRLLIDLDAIAAELGLSVGNTAFNSGGEGDSDRTETTDEGLYETITLSFSFVSNYDDFKSFLRLLQQSLRLIDVTSITVQTSNDPEFSTYKFVVNTYWLKR